MRKRIGIILLLIVLPIVLLFTATQKEVQAQEPYTFKNLDEIEPIYSRSGWRPQGGPAYKINARFDGGGVPKIILDGEIEQPEKTIALHAPGEIVFPIKGLNFNKVGMRLGIDRNVNANCDGVDVKIYGGKYKKQGQIPTFKNGLVQTPEGKWIAQGPDQWNDIIKQGNENFDWQELGNYPAVERDIEAKKVFLNNIREYHALRFSIGKRKNDKSDHLLICNAKLYNGEEPADAISETAKEIEQRTIKNIGSIQEVNANEEELLKYYFIKHLGKAYLNAFARRGAQQSEFIEYFFQKQHMKKFFMGGAPEQNRWQKAFEIYFDFWQNKRVDFLDTTKDPDTNVVLGELYQRMAISASLVYCKGRVGFWLDGTEKSDYLKRYDIFKELHNSKAPANEGGHRMFAKEVFDFLRIEHMRWVFDTEMSDAEIKWLNYQSRKKKNFNGTFSTGGYDFIPYTDGDAHTQYMNEFELSNPSSAKAQAKYAEMDAKWELSKFGIRNDGKVKMWVIHESGQVCGGISKHGCAMLSSVGIPSVVIGQPGHGAYLNYGHSKNGNGQPIWNIYNKVGGWEEAEKGERMPLTWKRHHELGGLNNIPYVFLAEKALSEDFDKTYISTLYNLILDYRIKNNNTTEEEKNKNLMMLKEGFRHQNYNYDFIRKFFKLDAEIIKREKDYALDVFTQALEDDPFVLFEVLNELKTICGQPDFTYKTDYEVYSKAQKAITTPSLNKTDGARKEMANAALRGVKFKPVYYSPAKHEGKRVQIKNEYLDTTNIADNNITVCISTIRKRKVILLQEDGEIYFNLTNEEIKLLLEIQDKTMHIIFSNDESRRYTIELKKASTSEIHIKINEAADTINGNLEDLEWSYDGENFREFKVREDNGTADTYQIIKQDLSGSNPKSMKIYKYTTQLPEFTENETTIYVRRKAHDNYFASDKIEKRIVKNVSREKNQFTIDYSKIKVKSASSEQRGQEPFKSIDGNHKTMWHSVHNTKDQNKEIVFEFDRGYEFVQLIYTPREDHGNGTMLKIRVFGSNKADGDFEPLIINFKRNQTDGDSIIPLDAKGKRYKYIKIKALDAQDGTGNKQFVQANLFTFCAKQTSDIEFMYAEEHGGKRVYLGHKWKDEQIDEEIFKDNLVTAIPKGYKLKGWKKRSGFVMTPIFEEIEKNDSGSTEETSVEKETPKKEQKREKKQIQKADKIVIAVFAVLGVIGIATTATVLTLKAKKKRED